MVQVRLFAIGIDQVRDWFGAPPEVATQLRSRSAERFQTPMVSQQRAPGLLGRIGPLFRRDPWAPVVEADHPTTHDVDLLVNGQFVPPDRLAQAWRVVDDWLEHQARATTTLTITESDLEAAEFELARCGVPSQYAVSRLWALDPALPLRPVAGLEVGYARRAHAEITRDELRRARDEVEAPTQQVIDTVTTLLDEAVEGGTDIVALVQH